MMYRLPRYVPQLGHTRCDSFGAEHTVQVATMGEAILCVARRLSRRALEVFRFGTAITRSSLANPTHGLRHYPSGASSTSCWRAPQRLSGSGGGHWQVPTLRSVPHDGQSP